MKSLGGGLRAVEHQLTHGEASEGDVQDIDWCARQVADVATALETARDVLSLREGTESAVSPADALPR